MRVCPPGQAALAAGNSKRGGGSRRQLGPNGGYVVSPALHAPRPCRKGCTAFFAVWRSRCTLLRALHRRPSPSCRFVPADNTWQLLESAIHEINSHNASGLSFEELYRCSLAAEGAAWPACWPHIAFVLPPAGACPPCSHQVVRMAVLPLTGMPTTWWSTSMATACTAGWWRRRRRT